MIALGFEMATAAWPAFKPYPQSGENRYCSMRRSSRWRTGWAGWDSVHHPPPPAQPTPHLQVEALRSFSGAVIKEMSPPLRRWKVQTIKTCRRNNFSVKVWQTTCGLSIKKQFAILCLSVCYLSLCCAARLLDSKDAAAVLILWTVCTWNQCRRQADTQQWIGHRGRTGPL